MIEIENVKDTEETTDDKKTFGEILDTLNQDQRMALYSMLGALASNKEALATFDEYQIAFLGQIIQIEIAKLRVAKLSSDTETDKNAE